MRAVPIAVTALAATLLLTACDSGDGGGDSESDKPSQAASSASGSCAADKLSSEVGPVNAAPAAGDTGNVTVVITNTGGKCTLEGFPKVELHAGDTSVAVPEDPAAQPQPLTLPEQGTASFTLTYVRGEGGDGQSLAVDKGTFALPGVSGTQEFTWTYGDLALKGESEPDASVTAVQPAGD